MMTEEIEMCKRLLPHFAAEPWDSPDFWDSERLAIVTRYRSNLKKFQVTGDLTLIAYEVDCQKMGVLPEILILVMLNHWFDYQDNPDPATYLMALGAESYDRQIDDAEDWMHWLIRTGCLQNNLALDVREDRAIIAESVAERIAVFPDKHNGILWRAMQCQELARITRLPCPAIEAAVKQIRRDKRLK